MGIKRKAMELLDAMARSNVDKILAVGPARSREVLTTALRIITEEFGHVSRDVAGSMRLYDAVSQASATPIAQRLLNEKDHIEVLDKARTQLTSVVRDVSYQRMQKILVEDLNLSEVQADKSLTLASSSVLETLKDELETGAVENSHSGITLLLIQESENLSLAVSDKTTRSAAKEKPVTSSAPAVMAGSNGIVDSHSASLFRFVPYLLLGLLVLGAFKYCSNTEQYRLVEQERVSLQQELLAAREDAEASTSSITALQDEFDSAQTQIQIVKSDLDLTQSKLQAVTAELAAQRDVPKESAELQMLLLDVTKERDAAVDSNQALNRQLEIVSDKHNNASVEIESIKAELEATRSIIDANKSADTQIRQLKENVAEINQKHDAALQRNASIVSENQTLRATIEESAPTIADLESQVVDLQTSNNTLEQKRKLDQKEISRLMSNVDQLQQRHQSAGPKINKLESRITSLHHEIATLEAELQIKSAALEEEQAARKSNSTRLAARNANVQNQLSQMMLLKDAAESRFGQQQSKISEQSETISDLKDKIDALQLTNEESKSLTVALQKKIGELDVNLLDAEERISASDYNLTKKDDSLAAANDELVDARTEIAQLKSTVGRSDSLQDELQNTVTALTVENKNVLEKNKSLNDQVVALRDELKAGSQSAEEAELRIAALEKSLDAERESLLKISNERDQIKDAIVVANADINSLTAEKTEALSKIASLNREISHLNGVVDAGRSTISDLEKGIREIEEENSVLKQSEDASGEKIVSLDTRMNTLGSELIQEREHAKLLAVKNLELEKQIVNMTKARNRVLLDIGKLQRSLATADQKIVELTDKQVALLAETTSAKARAEKAVSETLAMRNSIEQQLAEAGLNVVKVQSIENHRAVAITLGSKSLYQTGDASLTREGGQTLNKIGKILEKYPDWRIDIEGHTDSLPIGAKLRQRYPSNWELSSARASAVVTFLRLTTNVKTESLSAKGYAETQPIADNASAQGREQNRRVDIVLRK